MRVSLLNSSEPWRRALDRFGKYDFAHTFAFGRAEQQRGTGEPTVVVIEDTDKALAFTGLRRPLDDGFWDLGSPYGYVGPLAAGEWTGSEVEKAIGTMTDVLKAEGAVSLVMRMHPFHQLPAPILKRLGPALRDMGRVVGLDLQQGAEESWRQTRENHRRGIRKLKKAGYRCQHESTAEARSEFREIYFETMRRLAAKDEYFFPEEYFDALCDEAEEFDTRLYICRHEGKAAAAGMFIFCGDFVTYFLGGTNSSYLKQAPSKLIFDEVRNAAMNEGRRILNLGGGYSSTEDSLYHFKAGFSNWRAPFQLGTFIINPERYDELVESEMNKAQMSKKRLTETFFPRYRAPWVS